MRKSTRVIICSFLFTICGCGEARTPLGAAQLAAASGGSTTTSPGVVLDSGVGAHFYHDVVNAVGVTTPLDSKYVAAAHQHQILFINGVVGSDAVLEEATDNLNADFQIPAADFISVQPEGKDSFVKNSDEIHQQILNTRQAQKTPRPIILWGHSMGALEAFITVLRYPDLLSSGMVDHVILMQGPIHGTPFAEMLLSLKSAGPGNFWTAPLTWFRRVIATAPLQIPIFTGLESLSMTQTEPFINQLIAQLSPAQRQMMQTKAVFVTVAQLPNHADHPWISKQLSQLAKSVYPFVKPLAPYKSFATAESYLDSFGASDDVIPLQFQNFSGLGETWGPLPGSHMSWITSRSALASHATPQQVRAFTRVLMTSILDH